MVRETVSNGENHIFPDLNMNNCLKRFATQTFEMFLY